MIHNPFFTTLNPNLSLGKSMKRILLLLLAVIGCQAVDQLYPNFPNGTAAPDTVVISGAASSTAPLAGQVKIGGG